MDEFIKKLTNFRDILLELNEVEYQHRMLSIKHRYDNNVPDSIKQYKDTYIRLYNDIKMLIHWFMYSDTNNAIISLGNHMFKVEREDQTPELIPLMNDVIHDYYNVVKKISNHCSTMGKYKKHIYFYTHFDLKSHATIFDGYINEVKSLNNRWNYVIDRENDIKSDIILIYKDAAKWRQHELDASKMK